MACKFGHVYIDCGVKGAGTCVEIGNRPADGFEAKPKHQRGADQASPGVRGTTQHLLADKFKALQGKPRVRMVPGNDSDLRGDKKEVDVRNVVGNVVLKAKSELDAECETAVLRPEWFLRGLRRLFDGRRRCVSG